MHLPPLGISGRLQVLPRINPPREHKLELPLLDETPAEHNGKPPNKFAKTMASGRSACRDATETLDNLGGESANR